MLHCNNDLLQRKNRHSMNRFGKTMVHIQALRRKFEGLLESARQKASSERPASAHRSTRLRELTEFGANPGNLRMLAYVPERLPSMAPLVVALHGCSQSADEYSYGAGWSSLADRHGFAVVYPEQRPANNPKNCFSWFLPGDIARDRGEARSIQQMVEHAIATFGVDRRRVFVTGLSAGGAMAAVMLATYPEVFAGGAIIAGLPYGCARTVQQAFDAMFTEQSHSGRTLGDRVRKASPHRGPWPKISVWHGSADPIVKPCNAEAIIRQWTDVHGLSAAPSYEESIGSHTRLVWNDANGEALIEAFSISGMAHGVPLASTMGKDGCGATGAFFLDAGISSTRHIADFWRLSEDIVEMSRAPAMVSEPHQIQIESRAVAAAAEAAGSWSDTDQASFGANAEPNAGRASDPNLVIAAAFKAAGLPVPELPHTPAGTKPHVAPGPIIEAALKAVGLTRM
jgi:poly(hydroxyalkanoate) depolymerase family esterase